MFSRVVFKWHFIFAFFSLVEFLFLFLEFLIQAWDEPGQIRAWDELDLRPIVCTIQTGCSAIQLNPQRQLSTLVMILSKNSTIMLRQSYCSSMELLWIWTSWVWSMRRAWLKRMRDTSGTPLLAISAVPSSRPYGDRRMQPFSFNRVDEGCCRLLLLPV